MHYTYQIFIKYLYMVKIKIVFKKLVLTLNQFTPKCGLTDQRKSSLKLLGFPVFW